METLPGPGYSGGDRTPKTRQEIMDAPVARVDDPVTPDEADEIDLLAKPHDIAYTDAETFKTSNFLEYLKQIIAADQALIDGTREMLDKDNSGEIHLTDGERNYGLAMLDLFELKQFYQRDAKILIKEAKDLARIEAEIAKMILDAAWNEVRPYKPPVDEHDTRLHQYPDSNPLNNWYSNSQYRLPDPSRSNTYRIVWIGGDPLALDLDGDGVETIAPNGYSGALFDHNNDGIKTATGWIKGDDGLLVRDLNGNGAIDNGAELFGDSPDAGQRHQGRRRLCCPAGYRFEWRWNSRCRRHRLLPTQNLARQPGWHQPVR